MEDKYTKSEEIGGGISVASLLFTLGVLILFLYSPVAHYLGKWGDYWDNRDNQTTEQHDEMYYLEQNDNIIRHTLLDDPDTTECQKSKLGFIITVDENGVVDPCAAPTVCKSDCGTVSVEGPSPIMNMEVTL